MSGVSTYMLGNDKHLWVVHRLCFGMVVLNTVLGFTVGYHMESSPNSWISVV